MIFSSTFLSDLDSDLPYFSGLDTSCVGPKEFQSFGGKPWAAILTHPSPTPTGRSGGQGGSKLDRALWGRELDQPDLLVSDDIRPDIQLYSR